MSEIGIIVGSTRPGRKARGVADWVARGAQGRPGASYRLLDLAEQDLPLYDEPQPASKGAYVREHTRRWSAVVAPFDGFVIVTPEYNHGVPAALKNALDFLYAEWHDKAVGFVSYGSAGGARVVEQLRGVVAELRMADVRAQVMLRNSDFDADGHPVPTAEHDAALEALLDQVEAWSGALAVLRGRRPAH